MWFQESKKSRKGRVQRNDSSEQQQKKTPTTIQSKPPDSNAEITAMTKKIPNHEQPRLQIFYVYGCISKYIHVYIQYLKDFQDGLYGADSSFDLCERWKNRQMSRQKNVEKMVKISTYFSQQEREEMDAVKEDLSRSLFIRRAVRKQVQKTRKAGGIQ